MKLLGYIAFTIFGFGVFYLISVTTDHAEHAALTDGAMETDLHLRNSKVYVQEHAYDRSLEHLDKAIMSIRDIKEEIDPESQKTVDKAINQLKMVYNEILADTLNIQDMNKAFVNALNALTFAELKITESYLESHDLDKAKVALKYGMYHIKNALKYVTGQAREYEIHLYAEMDSIIENQHLSNDEIIARLERMLAELDSAIAN